MSRITAREGEPSQQDSYEARKRTGTYMILTLMVLTGVEFAIAVGLDGPIMLGGLAFFAVLEAWLIGEYFMHLRQIRAHIVETWHAVTKGVRD